MTYEELGRIASDLKNDIAPSVADATAMMVEIARLRAKLEEIRRCRASCYYGQRDESKLREIRRVIDKACAGLEAGR